MTNEQLADLRARITPGPWVAKATGGADDFNEVFTADCRTSIADAEGANAQAIALVPALLDEVVRLRKGLIDCAAHLAAAISLLKRGGKAAKKAAPSDKMFDQMLEDYRASVERARTALGGAHD